MSISFGLKRLCLVAVLGILGSSLAQDVQAEIIVVNFGGNENGNILGNGGTNDGSISIVGDDATNTLTITAAGSNGIIKKSPQNALSVQTSSATWWTNGGYMDVVFSITAGSATELELDTAVMKHFNADGIDSGETLEIWDQTTTTLLGTLSNATMDEIYASGGTGHLDLGITIPLGNTIRFLAVNTLGGWPQDTWVVPQLGFNATPEPASLALLGLGGLVMLKCRR